jgi:hypothetical protein
LSVVGGVFMRRRAERRAGKQSSICAGRQVREDADMAQMTKPETLQGGAAKIDYEHMSVPDVKST